MKKFKFSIIFILSFILMSIGVCGDGVVVINDIKSWNHPVKNVFEKNKIQINKIELKNDSKYAIFYVDFPYDPTSSETKTYFNRVFIDILDANGKWDYALNDERDKLIILIHWDKNNKNMDISYSNIDSKQ